MLLSSATCRLPIYMVVYKLPRHAPNGSFLADYIVAGRHLFLRTAWRYRPKSHAASQRREAVWIQCHLLCTLWTWLEFVPRCALAESILWWDHSSQECEEPKQYCTGRLSMASALPWWGLQQAVQHLHGRCFVIHMCSVHLFQIFVENLSLALGLPEIQGCSFDCPLPQTFWSYILV